MLESIEKYREMGIDDFVLRDLDDLYAIHGVRPEDTPGYEELSEEKKDIYRFFLLRFYNSWGIDARVNIKPKSIAEDGDYMKFDFDYYTMVNTITVVNKNAWR